MEILNRMEIGVKPEMAFKPGNVIKDKVGCYYIITSVKRGYDDSIPCQYGITNLDTGETYIYGELKDLVMLFSDAFDSVLVGTTAVRFERK